jgi:hypothetical protein
MPKIDYPQVIEEDQQELENLELENLELENLEKHHRYTHLFRRVKMLRLLKSGECANLGQVAEALGHSWRQRQRWFAAYGRGGSSELLVSRVHERGPKELVTAEKRSGSSGRGHEEGRDRHHRPGASVSFAQRRGFYAHPESVGALLRRRKVRLKTGRPRHEKADPKEQEAFKKSSPRRSKEGVTQAPALPRSGNR